MIFSLCWKNLQTSGAGEGTRTHTLADRNLNPTRLPIPPRPHIYQLVGLPLPTFFSSYVLILSVSWNTVDFLVAPAYIYEKRYAETSVGLQVDGFSYQQRPRVYIEIPRAVSFHWPQQWREILFVFLKSGILRHTSNHQPLLAAPVGLEPTTSRLTVWRSTD